MKKAAFLILCGLALAAHSLEISAGHPFPLYDEIAYVDLARDYGQRGVLGTVSCYASGDCREDNRHPLYMMALAPFTAGGPEDFTRGKLLSLLILLALVAFAFYSVRRHFGDAAAWFTVAALALSPSLAALGQNVSADGLFTLLYFAAIWTLLQLRDRLWGWGLYGLLCGLAWLSKGNGHFLLLGGIALMFPAGLFRPHRPARQRGGPLPPKGEGRNIPPPLGEGRVGVRQILLSVAGFVAGGWFLLLRNFRVWGNPFYNINNRQFWLDDIRSFYLMSPFPEWNEVGPLWYLHRHGMADSVARFLSGAGACSVKLVKAMAIGPLELWPLTGVLVAVLAAGGLLRAWLLGKRAEVLAAAVPGAALLAAFAWGTPVFGANLRYLMPVAISLLPFAAYEAAQWVRGRERRFKLGLAAACAALLWTHRAGLTADPRSLWSVSDSWRETSAWIRARVDAQGYLADPGTVYSEWDAGPVRRTLFPYDAPPERIEALLRARRIRFILVEGVATAPAADFLGRRRAFTSSDGRVTVYRDGI